MGLASYYRKYCKGFARIVAPLIDLAKKDVGFTWTDDCEMAFAELKDMLTSPPVLAHPDFSKPFQLHTDASVQALGVVLSQLVDGRERVIAYASRRTSPAEANYPISELECLAVTWGISKFRSYLHGNAFDVFTDHKALTHC
jgi:hypothetical protein